MYQQIQDIPTVLNNISKQLDDLERDIVFLREIMARRFDYLEKMLDEYKYRKPFDEADIAWLISLTQKKLDPRRYGEKAPYR